MSPLVSISIPLYQCESFIEKCLESVRQQQFQDYEVSLINDQTEDKSVALAENFIAKHDLKNWKIYHLEKNSGLSVVRNKGIELATGKYLFFMDSDDVLSADCLETLVEISEQTEAEMTIGQLECEQLETGEKSICIKVNEERRVLDENATILKAFAAGKLVTYAVNKLMRVDFLRENHLQFVPGLFAQDELWTFHLILKLNKIAVSHAITYTYMLHGKSVIHNRNRHHFENWVTIAQYIDREIKIERDLERRNLILKYLTNFKNLTLIMNWKAQENEELWKESYQQYKKLSSLKILDYFSAKFPLEVKKTNFLTSLPTTLGFKIFKWRYER